MAGAHGTVRPSAVDGRQRLFPGQRRRGGFFGRMKTESVYPGHWEERARDEVLALIDEYIRWHDHGRIKRSPGWMSPVQYRQSQGTAA
ncbi:integrase core domain-containing protein [Bifidobacterium longum subsp. infantis]|uniref:IS3 family transposase n=2 Tax=Bifidobacterium TaxID=1678 RepID=UPI002ED6DE6D